MDQYIKMLEFQEMIMRLKGYTVTERAGRRLEELEPVLDKGELEARLHETTEARILLDRDGTPPLSTTGAVRELVLGAEKGDLLSIEELEQISQFATLVMRLKRYLSKSEGMNIRISEYGKGMIDLTILKEEIERCIRNSHIDDCASRELKEVRRKKEHLLNNIRTKLESILRSKKECFSESFVSNRNGHYTLPVKREHKLQINGSVIDVSASGATYFIEPSSVGKLKGELGELEISESNEERRILYMLSDCVSGFKTDILRNLEYIEELDYVFAKAKLSASMNGVEPRVNMERKIKIVNGRHPLLSAEKCIPLNLELGDQIRGIIITGPNTGGKTVSLKTVGLFSVMAQCGLHLPCEDADIAMNTQVLCDIGDHQSILENLSTFSAHIKNVIQILGRVEKDSLVLMDELGSGTDPAEGMGIAVAILEELRNSGCNFITTTHYPEIKVYARDTDGMINARMAFDKESLNPLYRLEIGEAGESCALYIAKQLGMSEKMLRNAYEATYGKARRQETDEERLEEDRSEAEKALFDKETDNKNEEPKEHSKDALHRGKTGQEPEKKLINREQKNLIKKPHAERFHMGDSVMVHPQKKLAIVFREGNDKGEVGVQIQKKKSFVNYKRLQLIAKSEDLYPPDYDFNIIFDSVENRKAAHIMERKHVPGLEIRH